MDRRLLIVVITIASLGCRCLEQLDAPPRNDLEVQGIPRPMPEVRRKPAVRTTYVDPAGQETPRFHNLANYLLVSTFRSLPGIAFGLAGGTDRGIIISCIAANLVQEACDRGWSAMSGRPFLRIIGTDKIRR